MKSDYSKLAQAAIDAKKLAMPTYSNFHVGAALLTSDDEIILGCNIEISSYSLTLCAERVAIFKAISDGKRKFKAIAIASDFEGFISPCGACRQVISELCGEVDVILTNSKAEFEVYTPAQLLPYAFNDSQLPS